MDRELLIYALTRCKDTKYKRDANPMYVARTVDNFISSLEGMSLKEGREKLACEMQNIELCQKSGPIIITVGGVCGIGKSTAGAKLTATNCIPGEKVLVVVPTHAIGDEWYHRLRTHKIADFVQLYGITHQKVKCRYADKAKKLLGMGHSQIFKQRYCGRCKKNCLHKQSLSLAQSASVLIATHSHASAHQNFYQLKTLGNDERKLILVDEMTDLVKAVRLDYDTLAANLKLFKILSTGDQNWDAFISLTEGLLDAINKRKDYDYHQPLSTTTTLLGHKT